MRVELRYPLNSGFSTSKISVSLFVSFSSQISCAPWLDFMCRKWKTLMYLFFHHKRKLQAKIRGDLFLYGKRRRVSPLGYSIVGACRQKILIGNIKKIWEWVEKSQVMGMLSCFLSSVCQVNFVWVVLFSFAYLSWVACAYGQQFVSFFVIFCAFLSFFRIFVPINSQIFYFP